MPFPADANTSTSIAAKSRLSSGRIYIGQLIQNLQNATIIGLVISKNDARAVTTKSGERFCLCFTIRDSPNDSVNCVSWGGEDYINRLALSFGINDVVEIRNPIVKPLDNAAYKPEASSTFQLIISESNTTISHYLGEQQHLARLVNVPLKNPVYPITSLAEIAHDRNEFVGKHVNILFAVKRLGTSRELKAKSGKTYRKCDITVFDQSLNTFFIQLWDSEWIQYSRSWAPKDCVILAQDIKANYDEFRQKMVATANSKTIFTVDPDIREARILYAFIQSVVLEDEQDETNLEAIQKVYTIRDIINELSIKDSTQSGPFYGIAYAILSSLDLDGPGRKWISTRCTFCRRLVDANTFQCTNAECKAGSGMENTISFQQLDLNISISDHTATIENCRLNGQQAENLIGINVSEFAQMTMAQKTDLKWNNLLLERFKFYFKASLQNNGETIALRILDCQKVTIAEWCTCTPQNS